MYNVCPNLSHLPCQKEKFSQLTRNNLSVCCICSRYRSRFFVRAGHETKYASGGNHHHFFTILASRILYSMITLQRCHQGCLTDFGGVFSAIHCKQRALKELHQTCSALCIYQTILELSEYSGIFQSVKYFENQNFQNNRLIKVNVLVQYSILKGIFMKDSTYFQN